MYIRFLAFVFIVVMLPVLVLISVAIVLFDGLPVLYAQHRIGKHGTRFVLFKFRTMRRGAEEGRRRLLRKNESDGPVFKIRNDPRFTGIGRLLSHTGLDELPQLWNIVRGEMAFIGPRPFPVAEAGRLAPWMRTREDILPGVISPAILSGRYHKDFDAWMRSDVAYARSKTPWGDMVLLLQSVPFFVRLIVRGMLG